MIATAYPPTTEAHRRSQTIGPLPQSIELSPVQREILDLIVQDQTSIQGPVQPERAILLWSDGISESSPLGSSTSARRPSDPCVIAGWHRRHALLPQRKNFRRHSPTSFRSFSESQMMNLLPSPLRTPGWAPLKQAETELGIQRRPAIYGLQLERSLKSFTTNQVPTKSIEATGRKLASRTLSENSTPAALKKYRKPTVEASRSALEKVSKSSNKSRSELSRKG